LLLRKLLTHRSLFGDKLDRDTGIGVVIDARNACDRACLPDGSRREAERWEVAVRSLMGR
jgi:hypothetical protein